MYFPHMRYFFFKLIKFSDVGMFTRGFNEHFENDTIDQIR